MGQAIQALADATTLRVTRPAESISSIVEALQASLPTDKRALGHQRGQLRLVTVFSWAFNRYFADTRDPLVSLP